MKVSLGKIVDLPNYFKQPGILILFQKAVLQRALFSHLSQVLHSCLPRVSRHSLFAPKYVYAASLGVRKWRSVLHISDLRWSVICGVVWCRIKDVKMNEEGKQLYHSKIHSVTKLLTQWDCLSIKQETSSTPSGQYLNSFHTQPTFLYSHPPSTYSINERKIFEVNSNWNNDITVLGIWQMLLERPKFLRGDQNPYALQLYQN